MRYLLSLLIGESAGNLGRPVFSADAFMHLIPLKFKQVGYGKSADETESKAGGGGYEVK
jgi:hypothetical protein